jgi:hypothetical protein
MRGKNAGKSRGKGPREAKRIRLSSPHILPPHGKSTQVIRLFPQRKHGKLHDAPFGNSRLGADLTLDCLLSVNRVLINFK